MSDRLQVREATDADAPAIAAVMCRALQAAYLGPDHVASVDPDAAELARRDVPDARRRLVTLSPVDLVGGARAALVSDDPADRTLVAVLDGEVVGFHRLRVHAAAPTTSTRTSEQTDVTSAPDRSPSGPADDASGRTGEVASLYVDPDAWQAGSGDRLLRAGLEQLHLDGCSTAFLWVAEENERALRFYRRRGFVADGATQTYRLQPWGVDLGVELGLVRLVRDLPPSEPEAQGDASGLHDAGMHDHPTAAAFGPAGPSGPSERDRT